MADTLYTRTNRSTFVTRHLAFHSSPARRCASVVASGWARAKPGPLAYDECVNEKAAKVISHAQKWAVQNFTFGKDGEQSFVGQTLGELKLSAAQQKTAADWDADWSLYYVANMTFKNAAFSSDDGDGEDDGVLRVEQDEYDAEFAEMALDLTASA